MAAVFCVAGLWAAPAAQAMLSTDDGNLLALSPGVLGGALDGVGRLTLVTKPTAPIAGFPGSPGGEFVGYCSASLLSGGAYVLTAAHCVGLDVAEVSFKGGAVTRTVTQTIVNGGWLGGSWGSDLALLKLDTPITTIQGYDIASADVTGSTVLMAGYGRTGNGSTGWNDPNAAGLGYYGYNQFDALRATSLGGALYGFDFDNGLANQDTLCLLSLGCGTGLGASEGSIAYGDSGGGSFVWNGSQWLLAGVHSHASDYVMPAPCAFDAGQVCGDLNGVAFDSSFGEIFWEVAVFPKLAWVSAVLAGEEVPEPATGALLVLGVATVAGVRRKQRTRATA